MPLEPSFAQAPTEFLIGVLIYALSGTALLAASFLLARVLARRVELLLQGVRRVRTGSLGPTRAFALSEAPVPGHLSPELVRLDEGLRQLHLSVSPVLRELRRNPLRDEPSDVTGEIWAWLRQAETLLDEPSTESTPLAQVVAKVRGALFSGLELHDRLELILLELAEFDEVLRAPRLDAYRGRARAATGPAETKTVRAPKARHSRLSLQDSTARAEATQPTRPRRESRDRSPNGLHTTHEATIRRVAHRYADDAAAREDLAQEIRIAVWRALAAYRGEGSLDAYVSRIAHRCGARFARRQWRARSLEGVEPTTRCAEAHWLECDRRARLDAAIDALPEGLRRAIRLQLAGYSYREIGETLGIAEKSASSRVSRARKLVRDGLAG